MTKFKCARCGNVYRNDPTFTDEDRAREYKEDYPNDHDIEWDIVSACEDCFREYKIWFDALTIEQKELIEKMGVER